MDWWTHSTESMEVVQCMVYGEPRPHEGYDLYLIQAVGFGSKGSISVFFLLSRLTATARWSYERCMAGASPENDRMVYERWISMRNTKKERGSRGDLNLRVTMSRSSAAQLDRVCHRRFYLLRLGMSYLFGLVHKLRAAAETIFT